MKKGSSIRSVFFVAFILLPFQSFSFWRDTGSALEVRTVDGATIRPLAKSSKAKATCLFFIAHDCPIANGYAPEIGRIVQQYRPKNVQFYVVYAEPGLKPATAKRHAKDYSLPCTALLDPSHKLVQRTGATVTPEAAVLAPNGALLYRGRIDDRYVDFGKRRDEPTRRDLRLALDAVLANKPVVLSRTKSIGCFIPETH